jgi:hypothetical protein
MDDLLRVGREILSPAAATLAVVGPFAGDAEFSGII